jgi:hypothetical protein
MGILTSSADVLGILYELYGAQHGPLDAADINLIAAGNGYGLVQSKFADKTAADGLPTDVTPETFIFRPDTNIDILYAYYTTLALNTAASDADYANFFIYYYDGGAQVLADWRTNVAHGGITTYVPYYIGMTSTAVPAGKPITFEITKGGLGVGVGVGRLEIFYKQV